MNQNAAQVLRIVKATYGDSAFGDSEYDKECARPRSVAEMLFCHWREVGVSQEEKRLENMTKV